MKVRTSTLLPIGTTWRCSFNSSMIPIRWPPSWPYGKSCPQSRSFQLRRLRRQGVTPCEERSQLRQGVIPRALHSLPKEQQQQPPNLERGLRVTAATPRHRRPNLFLIEKEGARQEEVQRHDHARRIKANASTKRPSHLVLIIFSSPNSERNWLLDPD